MNSKYRGRDDGLICGLGDTLGWSNEYHCDGVWDKSEWYDFEQTHCEKMEVRF